MSPLAMLGAAAIAAGIIGLQGWAIHSLRGQVAALKTENSSLAAQITAQNDALEGLRELGDKRASDAAKAIAAAQAAARANETRAQRLLAAQLKPGEDACQAADALISETLWGKP